ncbi:MAG: hypothetical protein P8129_20505 [Anaerolineae bacterium]
MGIVLPDSSGALSTEDWDQSEIAFIEQEIQEILQWWTQQAQANGVPLEFVIPSTHPILVPTQYEPIEMIGLEDPYGDADIWISDTMAHLGYDDPGMTYLERVQKYDDDLRQDYQADWAVTIFAVDASAGSLFAPGSWGLPGVAVTAWAHRPGPHLVINDLSGLAARWVEDELGNVVAHEMGHVFGAADEVWVDTGGDCTYGSECNAAFGYLSIENQNCDRTPSCLFDRGDCVMRVGDLPYLCPYSAGQVGWNDSDVDGLPDPIDTYPELNITGYPPNPSPSYVLEYSAEITDIPWPTTHPSYIPVTINTVSVQYQIGSTSGPWRTALPGDGTWDSPYEENFRIVIFENGTYTIYLRAINKVGHTSATTSHTITINSSDPIYRSLLPIVMRNY